MKKIILIIFLGFLSFFSFVFAKTENVGIIKGIWFSESQFFDGDSIRIYTAVQNNSGHDVEGVIEFFDNRVSLGMKDFSALDGRIIESWIDTYATSGEHEFSVKITELEKNDVGSDLVSITAQEIFSERLVVIKIDTDGDKISDDIDTDDDGDGYSDEEERKQGTDHLDRDDVPVDESEEGDLDTETLIEKIIDKLFPGEEDSTKDSDDSGVEKTEGEGDIGQTPQLVQDLAEKNTIIKSLSSGISRIQNSTQGFIDSERERVTSLQGNSKYPKTERISTKTDDEIVEKIVETDSPRQKSVLLDIYVWLLGMFSWLFSLWWFVVALLFLGIYILLRLLFKIFGRRD